MHEFGLCEAILDAVERRAAGRRVTRVRVRVGALHRVVPPAMGQAFALAAEGTVADGADVELLTVPVQVSCRACGQAGEAIDPLTLCPSCGDAEIEVTGGGEIVLESIELGAPA
ncbi:MAG: hydrogenase maturation nickel metallochaperone HypA [Carbonactinosporaceae bacterium]